MFYKTYGKRFFDIVLLLLSAISLSWLLILVILGYLLLGEYPIFFKQKRVGEKNKLFWMWKFRTLSMKEELPLNERSFLFGRLLRFTSVDELPQLWNIVMSEMSFIGPRPLPEEYLPLYSQDQIERHQVKPGITGWAQVNGRNSITWKKKFELDVYYVNNVSFGLDLVILMKTLVLMLSFKKDVSLKEKKFTGD